LGKDNRATGARTDQKSAEKTAAKITALFEPFLITEITDKSWLSLQQSLFGLVLKIMRGGK